jgi:hypothetical protein
LRRKIEKIKNYRKEPDMKNNEDTGLIYIADLTMSKRKEGFCLFVRKFVSRVRSKHAF